MRKNNKHSLHKLDISANEPAVREIGTDREDIQEEFFEYADLKGLQRVRLFFAGFIDRFRKIIDGIIMQTANLHGPAAALAPVTAILVVFTIVIYMTVGGGAALKQQTQITCVDEEQYMQLAGYESQGYLDSDFNRGNGYDIDATDEIDVSEVATTTISETVDLTTETAETDQADETTMSEETEQIEETTVETTLEESTENQVIFENVDQIMYLTANKVNLRSNPDTSSEILDIISLGSELHRTGVSEKWSRVISVSGIEGYIVSKYLSDTKPEPTPVPTPEPTTAPTAAPTSAPVQADVTPDSAISADMQQQIVSAAYGFLGTDYVYAGSAPGGFDCSGFTSYMYRHFFGIDLPRTTSGQINSGISVPVSDIQIGDIICFDWKRNGSCDHVALYVGNGKYIDASYSADQVREKSLRPDFEPILSVRRIVY